MEHASSKANYCDNHSSKKIIYYKDKLKLKIKLILKPKFKNPEIF